MTARQRVEEYLENYSGPTDTLCFCNYDGSVAMLGIKRRIKREKLPLANVILLILETKEHYYSKNIVSMEIETRGGKHRSSMDIWRHCKLYFPNVTLLDVMHELYVNRFELRYQYCRVIYKRVFDIDCDYRNSLQRDAEEIDEYHLIFRQWKNINK